MEKENTPALFQQIGQIQGTLTALNANISDFKTEFRTMTNAQNEKIEILRKEVQNEIKSLSDKVDNLEQFKANYDGAQAEAKKSAQLLGGLTGAAVSIVIAGAELLVQHFLTK